MYRLAKAEQEDIVRTLCRKRTCPNHETESWWIVYSNRTNKNRLPLLLPCLFNADGSFVTRPLSEGNKESARCSHTIGFNFLSRQCENLMSETCQGCLIPMSSLSKMLLKVWANTMLNGFQRKQNDEISRKKTTR